MSSTLVFAVLFCFVLATNGNPAIEREFHRVVNSNDCLRDCLRPVRDSDLEMSAFKQSNFSAYFLNLGKICELMATARECIDGCGLASNPFALASMRAVCDSAVRKDVSQIEECLKNEGAAVRNQCSASCGDADRLNERIRSETAQLKAEDTAATQRLNRMADDACGSMKCSSRCSVKEFNDRCGQLADGRRAGDVLRAVVEFVLSTHRADLDAHGLVDTMAANSPPQCNYLYTPEALFSPLKDKLSMSAAAAANGQIEKPNMAAAADKPNDNMGDRFVDSLREQTAQRLSLTTGQLNVRLLEKQLSILEKMERNLDREFDKTNAEISRLTRKPLNFRF